MPTSNQGYFIRSIPVIYSLLFIIIIIYYYTSKDLLSERQPVVARGKHDSGNKHTGGYILVDVQT